MTRTIQKVGANDPCPCGRLKKYKVCCRGKVDWEPLLARGDRTAVRHLSTRGKNKLFVNLVLEALQLDTEEGPFDLPDLKRAFTSEAVRNIFEAVRFVWPDGEDLKRVLAEESEQTSGLYIGHYEPELIRRGVTRHSLYADRILLVDPLVYPDRLREKFNPILHPEEHRATTFRWISLWFSLWPWIDEGIVGFVRDPGDFYPDLMVKAVDITIERYKNPELIALKKSESAAHLASPGYEEFKEYITLSYSDDQIRRMAREHDPAMVDESIDRLVEQIRRRREEHPYFLPPEKVGESSSELHQLSTGTNYELAKLIALHSRSYVMTDLRVRWREIELDRADSGIDAEAWSPFAKAFQGVRFKFLDSIPLNAALAIRREGRLASLRSFLRKVWDATSKANPFDDANVPALAAELDEKVRDADAEWKKIDRELLKYVVAEAPKWLLAAGPLVMAGHAAFLGAAVVAAGIGGVAQSTGQRREYKLKYPAGFFVDLQKGQYD